MSEIRLHEGELNIMELLWSNKVLAAKDIAKIIKEYIGWEKNGWRNAAKKEVANQDLWLQIIPYFKRKSFFFHKVVIPSAGLSTHTAVCISADHEVA